MGPIDCPETSVINYHYSLGNNPEEGSTYRGICAFWDEYVTKISDAHPCIATSKLLNRFDGELSPSASSDIYPANFILV